MAKRKRASLKDKSSESLGLTPKKGKGLDLLFGSTPQEGGSQPASGSTEADDLSGLDSSGSIVAGVTDTFAGNEGLVDELGLPVAMEAPPDDLILASSPADAVSSIGGDVDIVEPSTSPFSMPGPEGSQAGVSMGDANDLSGLVEEANSAIMEDGNLSSSFDENDLSGLMEDSSSSGSMGLDDLSGLVQDDSLNIAADNLSGLVVDDAAAAVDDLSGLIQDSAATDDLSGLAGGVMSQPLNPIPSAGVPQTPSPIPAPTPVTFPSSAPLPPTTAAPISVTPPASPQPVSQPGPMPVMPSTFGTTPTSTFADPALAPAPTPVSSIPPPSTATGAPDLAPPRPAAPIKLDAVDENVAATLSAFGAGLTKEDFRPKDELPDHELIVREDEAKDLDAATKEQILKYIGTKRRDALFEEIQNLHERVSEELSGNKADVTFALDTLREANEYIIQKPYEYDEALYRVAVVKTMLHRKKKLTRSSSTLGFLILFYGVAWTIVCLFGFLNPIDFTALNIQAEMVPIFAAVWFSAFAGGLGGTVEVFWRLYYRVSIKQDFDPQYFMYYLVKPILGFVLGLVMYFLVSAGASISGGGIIQSAQDTPTGFALTLLFGFIAGFRQESVFDMIYVIVNKIAPDRNKGKGKSSVIPVVEDGSADTGTTTGELTAPGSPAA